MSEPIEEVKMEVISEKSNVIIVENSTQNGISTSDSKEHSNIENCVSSDHDVMEMNGKVEENGDVAEEEKKNEETNGVTEECTNDAEVNEASPDKSDPDKTEAPEPSTNKSKSSSVSYGALSQIMDYGISDSEDSESDSVSLSDSSNTSDSHGIPVAKPVEEGFRENDSSDSSTYYDSDSSSDSDDGACATSETKTNNKQKSTGRMQATLTKGELTLDDLPPIEQLQISVPEQECVQIGTVSSIVEQLVIVQSLPNMPAYDIDTLLFLDRGTKPLGRIFDVLGPVTEPFYAVRFNSHEQAVDAGVKPGTPVFAAPYNQQHTAYVFVSELMKIKGSDASWKHNNEPPEMFLDYSDDEQEAAARRVRKQTDTSKTNSLERNKKFERQMNNKNTLMNEHYNQPSTSQRPEPKYQVPHTPQNWSIPQAPRPIQRPEFCMPYGYFNHFGNFPMMPQFGAPPNMYPHAFNPHVPPPVMRPQPVSYFPNPRHPRWAPPNVISSPRGFGNGPMNQ